MQFQGYLIRRRGGSSFCLQITDLFWSWLSAFHGTDWLKFLFFFLLLHHLHQNVQTPLKFTLYSPQTALFASYLFLPLPPPASRSFSSIFSFAFPVVVSELWTLAFCDTDRRICCSAQEIRPWTVPILEMKFLWKPLITPPPPLPTKSESLLVVNVQFYLQTAY